jgi:hypothetical protein
MIRTSEVRWFFRSPPFPPADFFDLQSSPPTRVDWYAFPCDERSGVKVRQGKLETKLRLRELGPIRYGEASGRVEEWGKWSLAYPPNDAPQAGQLSMAGWVPVEKTRYMRIFTIKEETISEITDWQQNFPEAGVEFELTQLRVRQQQWWTVGFEAFAPAEPVEKLSLNLGKVVRHVFSGGDHDMSLFTIDNSSGYPGWLHYV